LLLPHWIWLKKILLIEDELDIRDLYTELLCEVGYEVETAADGDAGWEAICNCAWDCLLLDIMLPKMDGLTVLKKLVSDENLKKGPVLVLTNLDKDSIVEECLKSGATDYIIKSNIDPAQFVEKVGSHVSNE
jgi:DNA-binding response OmpR family regulator